MFNIFSNKKNINLTPEEFHSKLNDKDILLLDVRTQGEHSKIRIPGSKLIDIKTFDSKKQINSLDKNKTILVYCHSGARSYQVTNYMLKNGFEKIFNLANGIIDWTGPVEND
jgi:rhodanese-related sulfurtransferase